MEKNKMIIALIVIIIAILIIVATFSISLAKTDTKIIIMSNESLTHDDHLKVGLQAEFDNLAGKTIHFKLIDDRGNVSKYSIDTNVNGKAKLNLKDIEAGNYTVNVTFEGDDEYNPSSASQKLEVKDDVVEETITQQSTQSSSSNDEPYEGYWETSIDAPFEYHTEYDSHGGFRQYDRSGNLVGSSYDEDQDKIADYVPRRI